MALSVISDVMCIKDVEAMSLDLFPKKMDFGRPDHYYIRFQFKNIWQTLYYSGGYTDTDGYLVVSQLSNRAVHGEYESSIELYNIMQNRIRDFIELETIQDYYHRFNNLIY